MTTASASIQRFEPDSDFLPRTKLLSAIAFAIPLIPSPALVPAVAPLVIAILGVLVVVGLQVGTSTTQVASHVRPYRKLTVILLLLAAGAVAAEPSLIGAFRFSARFLLLIMALAFGATFSRRYPHEMARVMRWYALGAAAVALVAIATSVTGIALAGEIRPTRGLGLLPGGAKSAGVIRSYGESAIIYSGALVIIYRERFRFGLPIAGVLGFIVLLGASVAQSRNVYVTTAVTCGILGLHYLARGTYETRFRKFLSVSAVFALLFPLLVGVFLLTGLRDTGFAQYFIGEGTFERNANERLDHVAVAADLIINDPGAIVLGSSVGRWEQVLGSDTPPHNQFVSLLLFSTPIVGGIVIYLLYIRPVRQASSLLDFDSLPIVIWGVSVIYALSNYEGLFSPSLALMIGLLWSELDKQQVLDARGGHRSEPARWYK